MTLPQLLLWLPRHSALRRVVAARPPSYYTYSHHVSGPTGSALRHHVVKLDFNLKEQNVEYCILETFVNGTPLRSNGRVAAWSTENSDFFEEVIDAAANNVEYSAQFNTDPLQIYTGPPQAMPFNLNPAVLKLLKSQGL